MSAYPTPLTPNQVQSAMQLLTATLLGYIAPGTPPSSVPPSVYAQVRQEWQQRGQPFNAIGDDVTYLRSYEIDDQYNRQRDVQTVSNPADVDPSNPTTVLQVTTYIRVWQTVWEIQGPNSFDNARKIRSGLFTQDMHDAFAASGLLLYLVTDPAAPRRVPYFSDGQWWERVDFEASFNERVTETVVQNIVASVEVIVNDDDGVVADFTILLDQPMGGGLGVGPLGDNPYGE